MNILFGIITLVAAIIGALFGIGGGIIIKPALSAVSNLPLPQINALSGVTVLAMSIVSLFRYLGNGEKVNKRIIWISVGAVGGGFVGKYLFELMRNAMPVTYAGVLQYSLLIVLLAFALLREHFKGGNIHGRAALLASGLFMGTVSSFLGIGGGPVNLLIIHIILGVEPKQAAIYSIFIIICSQFSNVTISAISGGYRDFDVVPLLSMVSAAIAGGFIGPSLHRRFDAKKFERYYGLLLWALIALNIYNIIGLII